MADSCIISKEQLSQKELFLKSKLYGGAAPLLQTTGHQTLQPNQRQTQTLQQTQLKQLPDWKQPTLYKEQTLNSSPQRIVEHHKTQLKQVTDQKMENFLDEMSQQFRQTQNANVIPQSLLYQQTRMMEKQVSLLEQSQNAMAEVVNNIMNQGATGVNSASALKQQVFSENRRMILEMLSPFMQQLNEMKLLHESTKACSSDVGSKIDELKRVMIQVQTDPNFSSMQFGRSQQMSQNYPYQEHGLIDPNIVKKGIDDLKDYMKEAQKEAMLIENEIQNRHTQMTMKNMQSRYLPQSITEEFSQFNQQLKEKTMTDHIQGFSTMTQTKEAIMAKLGGHFDYPLYLEELRQIISEKDIIEREFKSQALVAPEFKDKAFGRVPQYDFSVNSLFISSDKPANKSDLYAKMSMEKPQYIIELQQQLQQPKSFMDYNTFKEQYQRDLASQGPLIKKTVTDYQPKTMNAPNTYSTQNNQRQTYNQKQVSDRLSKRQPSGQQKSYKQPSSDSNPSSQHSTPNSSAKKRQQNSSKIGKGIGNRTNNKGIKDFKNTDILTLKKQVIEELKSELDLKKNNNSNQGFPLDFTPSLDNITKPHQNQHLEIKSTSQLSQVIQQETDKQSQILTQIKTQQDLQINNSLRQSTTSVNNNGAFSQSLLENAFADLLMSELRKNNGDQINQDEEVKKVGEEIFIHKLNNIFDELAKENTQQFQPIQQQQQQNVQILDQQQQQQQQLPLQQQQLLQTQQQQPVVIPIVINQSNNQQSNQGLNSAAAAHDILKDQNKLRDMLSQVISAQLSMHNIRKDNAGDNDNLDEMADILNGDKNNRNRRGMRDSMMSQDPLNQTSRTLQEEEAKLKAEQQELRKQTFINVQPYIQQTLSMGYQNPFAFGGMMPVNLPKTTNLGHIQQPLLNDLDQFNLTSDSSDFLSMNSSKYSDALGRGEFFHSVNHTGRDDKQRSKSRKRQQIGGRYSTLSQGDRSDGEIGAVDQSDDDDISVGEIRFPNSTLKQSHPKGQTNKIFNNVNNKVPPIGIPIYNNNKLVNSSQGRRIDEIRKLGETINYEEDKEYSPEKDEEKPILDSSDGPIPKPKARFGNMNNNQGKPSAVQNVGKSGANNLMSGESFGINPYRLARGLPQQQQQSNTLNKPTNQKLQQNNNNNVNNSRMKIEDNFLEEDYDEDFASIRDSRESGEINPAMWK